MSDPIIFPITAYYVRNSEIHKVKFREDNRVKLTLRGKELKVERNGLFGDYGNDPEYYVTDLALIKAALISRLEFEFNEKVRKIENYGA